MGFALLNTFLHIKCLVSIYLLAIKPNVIHFTGFEILQNI